MPYNCLSEMRKDIYNFFLMDSKFVFSRSYLSRKMLLKGKGRQISKPALSTMLGRVISINNFARDVLSRVIGRGINVMAGKLRPRNNRQRSSTLEETLLNEEERAILQDLNRNIFTDLENETSIPKKCTKICCSKAALSLFATFSIMVVGILIIAINSAVRANYAAAQVGGYVLLAGLFGLFCGGISTIGILMLVYKIPLVVGTGVFYRRHKGIRDIIKLVVLQMLFETHVLEDYILSKTKQFQTSVQVAESVLLALNKEEAEQIIEKKLNALFASPEEYYFSVLGITKESLKPMVKPAVLSLCAEATTLAAESAIENGIPQGVDIPRFREEMDRYLSWRVTELTEERIGSQMRRLLLPHLGWIIVWSSVFGSVLGLTTQALGLSISI